ncbi:MAG TPA: phosphoribosyltransferase [Tepidisphaeraceae bacterium]|jgi:predicted phosphoribosyltransferase|nr:phosphoribosyltransferase [Tepidisphaeraceae bacterium]
MDPPHRYLDRLEAGRILAGRLRQYADRPGVLVLALPRGGVPVGLEVARQLNVPLDVFVVRKLGTPGHEELAMGAIASGGVRVENERVIQSLGIDKSAVDEVAERELEEVRRRERYYRDDRPPPKVQGRTVILVDDGLATGSTMAAAAAALRKLGPARLVIAVPVGAPESCAYLRRSADEVVCVQTPEDFTAVGEWYEDFGQTTDEEVRALLNQEIGTRVPEMH